MKLSGAVASTEGLPIYYDLYTPDSFDKGDDLPVILFVHGFKGFKDWGAFPEACKQLSSGGFAVLAMNFSLNGVGESMTEFDQLDLFARETFSQDLDDIGSVVTALKEDSIELPEDCSLETENIGILGHSRGGHTATTAAAEYSEIKCLVTWSAVADYKERWSSNPLMVADWEEGGVTEIKNGRTGQMMPLKKIVFEDILENADRLVAVKRVEELSSPALFIHSRGDEGVSYKEAEKLYGHCSSEYKELQLMPDSGHTFDTSHPYDGGDLPSTFQKVLKNTGQWFKNHLQ
ncbi:alpha/beta hydrolase family protein [Fodinibius salsisoli]|uniref:Alpha/beta hydrolase n=1 Tax=Fodinibius salsisoli TaxID=2820877 RepID=A0ABT3PP53_9BACT|nr:alpha/beta fold hydrolase [Fodinibius salsisoli]MCW9707628.1 alpha/beta hydrolase [Fodinibius salsisoli]